ncbi:MAG: tetratricopeptide repeat protein [Vicinamibacterales bacterium]
MRQPFIAGLLIAAASVAFTVPSVAADSGWSELKSGQFVLRAPEGLDEFDLLACDAGRVATALSATNRSARRDVQPAIVAVGRERDTRELLPQFWERRGLRPVGAYWSGPHGHHILVRVNTNPGERFRRILHEYAHFATHVSYSNPPPWLDEGLSELWTNSDVSADRIELGRPVDKHLDTLRSAKTWIPIAELTSAVALPEARDTDRVELFYAEAWALAHYLAIEKGLGVWGLPAEPTAAVLPTDEELRQYVASNRLRTLEMAIDEPPAACQPGEVRQLSEAETLLAKARMLADGDRPDAALPMLRELLEQEPRNLDALETLAYVHFRGNRPGDAAAAFDRVIAGGAATFISYYYRAVLADAVPQRTNGAGPVPAAEYFAEAERLNPGFAAQQ